jgi:hypothetical protein
MESLTSMNLTCPGGSAYPSPVFAPAAQAPAPTPGDVLILAILDPGLTLGIVDNGDNTASYTLAYEGEAWIGLGVSTDGVMVGSFAVIGLPNIAAAGEDPVKIYSLSSKERSGVFPVQSDQQILTSSSIAQENGITTLTFTIPLESDTPFSVSATGDTGYIYAYGSSNELGYHAGRGAVSTSIAALTPAPAPAPGGRWQQRCWTIFVARFWLENL